MSQVSNDETFTLIIDTGSYSERLTTQGLAIAFKKYGNKTVEDIFDYFTDSRKDDDKDYIIAVSAESDHFNVPTGGVTEAYGTLAHTYSSILSDLATVVEDDVVKSHVCIGDVNMADSFNVIHALIKPQPAPLGKQYHFFWCHGISQMEIKTAESGRRFIIAYLDSESG